jgi:exopolyphosphatase / guanosine-5'-triphosphate,3'-diphosphate pyrophosphatase
MIIASIDIGTNTILLLIAQANLKDKKIKVIFENQKIPRIGEGLKPGFPISEMKEKLLLQILASFKVEAEKYNCDRILVTATHALRIASNRDELLEKIKNQLQIEVNVVSGIEEAKLTFLGCTNDFSIKEDYAVLDIGGGSTEIIFRSWNKLASDYSLPLGCCEFN